jgi:Zn finger protein HypA/HybF involved in hydrogenase expression
MRLATAKDEISIQKDRRVQENSAYGAIAMLSRVIIRLGELTEITPKTIEDLFTLDLAYLKAFYSQINQTGDAKILVQCPKCASEFKVEMALSGESQATP